MSCNFHLKLHICHVKENCTLPLYIPSFVFQSFALSHHFMKYIFCFLEHCPNEDQGYFLASLMNEKKGAWVQDEDMEFKDDEIDYLTYHQKSDIRPGHPGAQFEIQTDEMMKPNVTIRIHEPNKPDTPVYISHIKLIKSTLTKVTVLFKSNVGDQFKPLIVDGTPIVHYNVDKKRVRFDFDFMYVHELRVVAEDAGQYDEFYNFGLNIIGCRYNIGKSLKHFKM